MINTISSWRRRLAIAAALLTGLATISLTACTTQQGTQPSPLLPARAQAATGAEAPWWAGGDAVTTLHSTLFARDSSALTPRAEAALAQVARQAARRPDAHLTIDGHTDSDGSAEHGKRLSLERADTVAAWLTGHGVRASRITTHGWGEARPAVSNTTERNKAINRRVTVTMSDTS